jgi:hypothetical protein
VAAIEVGCELDQRPAVDESMTDLAEENDIGRRKQVGLEESCKARPLHHGTAERSGILASRIIAPVAIGASVAYAMIG